MIYVLAALLPPLGLLLNGQPFSAIFNLVLIRVLRDFRAGFPRPAAGAVGACADRGSYETGRSQAPGRWWKRSASTARHRVIRADASETGLSALSDGNRVIRADVAEPGYSR